MDPISDAINELQKGIHTFNQNDEIKALRVRTELKHVGMISKVLRAEEWDVENRRPFIVFERAFIEELETFEEMSRTVREQYALLKEGLEEEGESIPDLSIPEQTGREPLDELIAHITEFTNGIRPVLEPPVVCWLPTDIREDDTWRHVVARFFGSLWNHDFQFVIADDGSRNLDRVFRDIEEKVSIASFEIDESATTDYFKELMSAPSSGRPSGTLPGVAAPDVEPPPRPGTPRPSDEDIREAMEETGVSPILPKDQAERLRRLVFEAGAALGEGKESVAINKQSAACELCADAGVKLEEALMTLLLANYYLQSGRNKEAEASYQRAEELAGEDGALPQVAQARMARAYLLMEDERIDEAARLYEQAAAAAVIGEVNLLYFEALRMAGTSHMEQGRQRDAYYCWKAAVEKGRDVSADEVRVSSFLEAAGALIDLLKKNGLNDQVASVERLIADVGEKSNA